MKNYGICFLDDFLYEKIVYEGLSLNYGKTFISIFNTILRTNYIDLINLETFTEANIKRFLGEGLLDYKWSSHTYNRYRRNLKVFSKYLISKGYIKECPLKDIKERKTNKTLPKFLTSIQVKEFRRVVNSSFKGDDFINCRNRTILLFYLFTGLRLYELINLKLDDINVLDGIIKINRGKGGKDRIVPLVNDLCKILISYLEKRKDYFLNSNILFPTAFGNNMQHRYIYEIFYKVRSKLDFKFTPHTLRHTFATECVRKNINIYNISRILGHSDLKTTQIYLGLDFQDLSYNLNKVKLFS